MYRNVCISVHIVHFWNQLFAYMYTANAYQMYKNVSKCIKMCKNV